MQGNEAQIFILTGFFGAGKTTFIRKLLTNPHH
jgi:G3E family GTPase